MTDPDLAATSADAFARLAIELHDAPGVDETVDAVVQFALQALNCTYAGVALHTRGNRPEITAVTDPVVADAFELQIRTQNGPLVTALRERTTILIRDTTTDDRWPEWAAKAMGILMERFDVDGDQAFAILKRYSQDTNTKLRDVAQQLVDTRKLPH